MLFSRSQLSSSINDKTSYKDKVSMFLFLIKLEPSAGGLLGSKTRISSYYVMCLEGDMNKNQKHSHLHFMNHSYDKYILL